MRIIDSNGFPCGRSRRHVLKGLAATAAVASVSPSSLLAGGLDARVLAFVHTHSRERLSATYFAGGSYRPEGLAALSGFMRDHRTGDEHAIDPSLYDILFDLRAALGSAAPFSVISAYRSPRTNAMLRGRSRGVAAGSLHLEGRAIDLRLDGVDCMTLRDAAIRLRRGGVGYYASSDFVHLDTGRFRTW